MADHRLRLRSADIEAFTLALAAELGRSVPALSGYRSPAPLEGERARFVAAVARDLAGKRGAALVIPGERQTALTHAVAQAINAGLGAVGATAGRAASERIGLKAAADRGRDLAWRGGAATPQPAGVGQGEPPAWATAMRNEQRARHHRHLVLDAVSEGDRGGGAATPDISERD
jgi:type IV secretory pathway TrbL component